MAAAIAALLTACGGNGAGNVLFSGFESVPETQWVYYRPVEFTVDSAAFEPDSSARGALVLSVRHNANYPYRNVWVEVTQPARCDTFEVMLADAFGRWYGSGMGASLRLNDTLCADYILCGGDRIVVRHLMRTDTLPGIEQIGLLLKQTD